MRISPEAVGRAARFACDEVVRLPERKARTPKGPQGAERALCGVRICRTGGVEKGRKKVMACRKFFGALY